jgi:hypothetical protein
LYVGLQALDEVVSGLPLEICSAKVALGGQIVDRFGQKGR